MAVVPARREGRNKMQFPTPTFHVEDNLKIDVYRVSLTKSRASANGRVNGVIMGLILQRDGAC